MVGGLSGEETKSLPIDFSSAESLPESHKWSSNGCSDEVVIIDGSVSIPMVDLQDPNNAMETIKFACEEWGVFLLKNHGIPLSLLNGVHDQMKLLFSLPIEQKAKALRRPGGGGYGYPANARFSPKLMWHEGFAIIGSSYDNVKKVLPQHDVAHFCEIMEETQKQLKMVAEKVTDVIMELLGIHDEDKNWVKSENIVLKMTFYPSCPDPDRAMGIAPHKDTSIVTFLHQTQVEAKTQSNVPTKDQTSGLQVFKEGIGWVPVNPDPDVLVVNVGDMLEILSNGRFTSVQHRATVSGTAHRYSFAHFIRPSPDTVLSPIGSPPRFRALTSREYDTLKLKDPYNVMASISI